MAELSNAEEAWIVAENELRATKKELADFRQEVSDVVHHYVYASGGPDDWEKLKALIIPAPKPDPLVDVLLEIQISNDVQESQHDAIKIRKALDALGFEIREKNDD